MTDAICSVEGCERPRRGRDGMCSLHVYVRTAEYHREYRVANRERIAARRREYAQLNKERLSDARRERRKRNRTKLRAAAQAAREADPEGYRRRTRNSALVRSYGITLVEYEAMFAAQGMRCAVCRTDDPKTQRGWHVDHCHETGKVRGVLCGKCNAGIGMLRDDPNVMRAAADYLDATRT